MPDRNYLEWPFFEPRHRELAKAIADWTAKNVAAAVGKHPHSTDVDNTCRRFVRQLGEAGWLRHAIAGKVHGGAEDSIDTRAICLIREALAYHSGLADFCFALQGLGSGAISLFGSDAQKQKYLPGVVKGESIAALAISEVNAGSDVA
ncbi:MAG TPA: acyl-CoA dehydrogenase family protein, partial [Terriglobales bacterium]|nr:acyl-CoA dehydrogenase family protein [Terriglobales bacterium]